MKLVQSISTALARHAINAAGASLVAKGVLTADQNSAIVGGILAAIAVAWSLIDKHETNQKLSELY